MAEKLTSEQRVSRLAAMHATRAAARDEARAAKRLKELTIAGVRPPDFSAVPEGPDFCRIDTARCVDAKDYKRERRPCCVAINREVLRYVTELLSALEIRWWADYGTLLGAVRHGGMIPWDKDSDLGVLEEDKRRLLELEYPLKRLGLGFSGSKRGTVKITASATNKTNTDMFAWHLRGGKWHRHAYVPGIDDFKGREFPMDWLFPLTTVIYDGLILNAPAALRFPGTLPAPQFGLPDGSAFLEHRYPPDWRTSVRANNAGQLVP